MSELNRSHRFLRGRDIPKHKHYTQVSPDKGFRGLEHDKWSQVLELSYNLHGFSYTSSIAAVEKTKYGHNPERSTDRLENLS